MASIHFTREALKALTLRQHQTLLRLAENESYALVDVYASNPFDLPAGYLAVRMDYTEKVGSGSVYGGISKDGDLST
jgi:hypothetical protein